MIPRLRLPTLCDLLVWSLLVLPTSAQVADVSARQNKLVIFAAASLKDALDDVNTAVQRDKGQETTTSFAASSTLAKQIEAAAPADIFISAGAPPPRRYFHIGGSRLDGLPREEEFDQTGYANQSAGQSAGVDRSRKQF